MVAQTVAGDQKKATACRGVVLFEDEASFWLDGTLHQTWARVGCQPRVDTYGQRKTAHLYATVSLHDAQLTYWFADVFNGKTFWSFLHRLVAMEPVWKTTRKMTTHNRFYETTQQRDNALRATFKTFQRRPSLIAAHVARYR